MKTRTKIWVGLGAFVVAGSGSQAAEPVADLQREASPLALARATSPAQAGSTIILAQHTHGQGGEGEGGEAGSQDLPPDLAFALRMAHIRGHLLIGDELVKQGQWAAALPHFLHPTEEIYGAVRGRLKDYQVPPFEAALKVLANTVKAKKGGEDYAKAWKPVSDALAAADAGLQKKQADWPAFTVETALELLKTAASEYELALAKNRIAKPVEYQDARGFVRQAETMIEAQAQAYEKKDADALRHMREAFAMLKKAFPSAMPPRNPVKDYGGVLSDVSRIELAAGKLM
jgi:hypothetical protein